MIRRVIVLEEAARDIEGTIDFYETAEPGVGDLKWKVPGSSHSVS